VRRAVDMRRILRFLRDAPSIGLIGQTALDTVTTADGRRVERLGGSPLYARRALRAAGVEPVVVTRAPGLPDALVLPSRSVVRSILDHLPDGGLRQRLDEVGEPFSAAEMARLADAELRECAWLLLGGQSAGDFPPAAIAALRDRGRHVLLDGQGLARGPRAGPVRLRAFPAAAVEGVQALKLNRAEAAAFGPEELDALPVPELLVTDGAAGVQVRAGGRWMVIDAGAAVFPDPVGAGDSFAALYALERARGAGPAEAARLAVNGVEALYAP
jgi:sugar/nucleoside kinase (ribokinase family)